MVEAAGGVVWRAGTRRVEILAIHRPHRDDWSLPKGKLRRRESPLACALREVEEETGLVCEAGDTLPQVRYRDRKGRPKRVRYWAMQELEGEFCPNDEVDEIRWVRTAAAGSLLSYTYDFMVVAGLEQVRLRLRVG